jgi:hypothetical integral membrane protein (TIGR02206 family)
VSHFAADHVAALAATVLAAAAVVLVVRRGGERWALPVRRGLGVLILAAFATEQVTYAVRGAWTVRFNLPLQLTDAVTLVSIAALWRPGTMLLVELVYFWALTASVQAVVTPDLGVPFPDLLYFTYFATHSGAVVAACLLVLGCGRIPGPGAAVRVWTTTVGFAAAAAVATVATGGNYMFLRRKPARGSVLDHLGPWPWYIAGGAVLGLLMLLALAAVAGVLRRRAHGFGIPRAGHPGGRDWP